MALLESNQLPLGTQLPPFELKEPKSGQMVSSKSFAGSPLLVIVMCNHCPYVVRVKEGLVKLSRVLEDQGIRTVALSSNDPTNHPDDAPQNMTKEALQYDYPFPYLFDEHQSVAASLRAVCTPEFFLFDSSHGLVYRGQMDGARPGNEEPNDGRDILAAVSALLTGAPPIAPQHPSRGCSIKWRPGNEPDYVRTSH